MKKPNLSPSVNSRISSVHTAGTVAWYNERFALLDSADVASSELYERGKLLNPAKPMQGLQGEMFNNGLLPAQVKKNGSRTYVAYTDVLKDVKICSIKGIVSEWQAFLKIARQLSAVQRSANARSSVSVTPENGTIKAITVETTGETTGETVELVTGKSSDDLFNEIRANIKALLAMPEANINSVKESVLAMFSE